MWHFEQISSSIRSIEQGWLIGAAAICELPYSTLMWIEENLPEFISVILLPSTNYQSIFEAHTITLTFV